jgi:manganese-dependent inorganic pyrophosphatase
LATGNSTKPFFVSKRLSTGDAARRLRHVTLRMNPASAAPLTYVIGHRNPDADSICSAIAYAAYKEARGERGYVAARCGNSNARIDAILARFRQPLPTHLGDVYPRVRDLMAAEVVAVPETATCAEALELIDRHNLRQLPVTSGRRAVGLVSLAQLGSFFLPRPGEPRLMRQVRSSLACIVRALGARAPHVVHPQRAEELFVRLGTMDISSFWQVSERENIPAAQSLIIVGDRRDIQRRAIELGVRAIILTSGLEPDAETVALAQARGVSLVVSPHDSATTAWVVRTASTLDRVIQRQFTAVGPEARVADIRRKFSAAPHHALIVTGDDGALLGILTQTDILRPVPTRLVLVDHNELTQAVPGADEVSVVEIIDHHRLGPVATPQPILFLNEPVGSTCTIVAGLFRRDGLLPSPELAGLMMSGLISDTLLLKSPTSTPKDAELLAWLAPIAGVEPRELADLIFSSGSVILASTPDRVVRSDFKIYTEDGVRFSVSQVEELGFHNFHVHAKALAHALAGLRAAEHLAFACLLVTDINTQGSLMLVEGDPTLVARISYARTETDELFDLPGVVSRKKQLIPYFTSLLRELASDDLAPSSGRSGTPFRSS